MSQPVPRFIPHPDLEGHSGFITVPVDLKKVVASYRDSLFSFEWLTPEGKTRSLDEMTEKHKKERIIIEEQLDRGLPLPTPVLGIGLMGNIEIGAERAVLLTLAARGVQTVPVHIPVSMEKDFRKYMVTSQTPTEGGNVIVYVLLAIVLIAALSYTVTRTGRSTNINSVSDGQASTFAAEVLTYANHVKTATAKLKLRDCTDAQLNFENDVVAGYTNGSAPVDESCNLFAPTGGTLAWLTPPTGMNDGSAWFYTGAVVVHNDHGVYSTNTVDNADLTMLLFNLPQNICTKINKNLGIDGIPVDDGSYADTTKFTGSFSAVEEINGLPDPAQPSPCESPSTPLNLCGLDAGCFREESGGQRYVFYQVLVKRP